MVRDELKRAARSFRGRVIGLLFSHLAARGLILWFFFWGGAVLVLRAAWGVSAAPLVWGLTAAAAWTLAALVAAVRRAPAIRSVYSALDRYSAGGGLLMAGSEVDLGAWVDLRPEARRLRLRRPDRRTGLLLVAASAFVALAFLVPQRYVALGQTAPLRMDSEAATLRKQIEMLEENHLVSVQEASEMKERLQKTQDQATGENPARTWEALDHLSDRVANTARLAAEEAARQDEKLAKAERLAEALDRDAGRLDPASLAESLKELGRRVEEAARESEALREAIPEELLRSCASGRLGPSECQRLGECLKACRKGTAQCLGSLAQAKLIEGNLAAVKLREGSGRTSEPV